MSTLTTDKPATTRVRKMAREPKLCVAAETQVSKTAAETFVATPKPKPQPAASKFPTKTYIVLGLLARAEGATLQQLVEATGWLPHTTRASLTGLKKKGHEITSTKADGVDRIYRISTVQQAHATARPERKSTPSA